ncbi:subtilisin-like protein, partial [Hesseltinella vesiculosa]
MMSSVNKPINEYPSHGLMPKQDTQAASFMKKFPEYDGRNTVVAILDTGVDPGAEGMQVTTNGKPKIIDIVDCTGGGDVDTSTIVKASTKEINGKQASVLEGLSGRTLVIDPSWKNPSGDFHLGLKRAYELFPTELVSRLKSERRTNFEVKHSQLLSAAQTALNEFNKKNTDPAEEPLLQQRKDLENRVEQLKKQMEQYEDPGVILDCVVFNDGKDWRAVVDVTETGELQGQPALADYRKELQYHTFGQEDLLNFSVNIYDDGDLLSIVTVSGSHGTHVAGITAGNFPEDPTLNGVAPGAQLVSLRIGDSRLGSMETAIGLTRAAAHMAMHDIDLANMSYGESSGSPVDGYFIEMLAKEAIAKSGCIFVTSAGNDGPCFSSIGAPAGMHSSFITVGAYVKHAQMQAEYALLESVAERPYTWSSRGPCVDGYIGVDIYAPGSAITSVPVYGLEKLALKNGTSMSSPNACGCIALLVSALKGEKTDYTPFRLKNAVVQTGKSVNDPLGVGFIQVDKAWDYLEAYKERKDVDINFEVFTHRGGKQRGIYLREAEETSQPQYIPTEVAPTFMGEKDTENPKYNRAKFEYDARVALVATQSWISAPDFVYLHSGGNTFPIKVDPTALSTSEFHFGEVLGYDTACPDRGPLFRIPVSVVKPSVTSTGSISYEKVEYGPGDIIRRFVHVPEGATHCELTLRARAPQGTSPARFMLHLLQLIPCKSQKDKQTYTFMLGSGSFANPDTEDQVIVKRFGVKGGLNLEVALAQFWSGLGKHAVELSLEFHGVQVGGCLTTGNKNVIKLDPEVTRLDICAPIRREEDLSISVNFSSLRKFIRPTEAVLAPLKADRNTLPTTRILYGLTLTYDFKVDANTTITPYFPAVMDQLYEHYLAGVIGIVYDANRKVVGYLDVFQHNFTLATKGDYTIQLQVSTEDEGVLEKLKATICELNIKLSSGPSFNTFKRIADAFTNEKSNFTNGILERKNQRTVYVATPFTKDWLPSQAKPGDALVGTMALQSKASGKYTVVYPVPPAASTDSKKDNGKKNDDNATLKELEKGLTDLRLASLKKLDKKSDAYKSLVSELDDSDVDVLAYKLSQVWAGEDGKSSVTDVLQGKASLSKQELQTIVDLAAKIEEQYDTTTLLTFYAVPKPAIETDDQKRDRKDNDKKKQALVKALQNRVAALTLLEDDADEASVTERRKQADALSMWSRDEKQDADLTAVMIQVCRERKARRYGNALELIQKFLDTTAVQADTLKNVASAWEVRQDLYTDLSWPLWKDYDTKWNLIRHPPGGFAPL